MKIFTKVLLHTSFFSALLMSPALASMQMAKASLPGAQNSGDDGFDNTNSTGATIGTVAIPNNSDAQTTIGTANDFNAGSGYSATNPAYGTTNHTMTRDSTINPAYGVNNSTSTRDSATNPAYGVNNTTRNPAPPNNGVK